ncbi:uncharacterized protein LOC142971480 [Anarhichas minor]|uniref:uncharacterized protein LOC142971480 n=1 Tax=Anarhichas minor TaxID=65739 RepID=UPI003F732921
MRMSMFLNLMKKQKVTVQKKMSNSTRERRERYREQLQPTLRKEMTNHQVMRITSPPMPVCQVLQVPHSQHDEDKGQLNDRLQDKRKLQDVHSLSQPHHLPPWLHTHSRWHLIQSRALEHHPRPLNRRDGAPLWELQHPSMENQGQQQTVRRRTTGGTTERRSASNQTLSGSCQPGPRDPHLTPPHHGLPLASSSFFFSCSVVQKIIDNTNANAAKRKLAGMKFQWAVLTVKDFYVFLSIIIFTGLVTVHNRSDYWRKRWPYNFQFPGDSMTRDRFNTILCSLHLSNPEEDEENENNRNTAEYDRLFKIKPLYTDMVTACKAHFQPHQNVSIDERMVASKARISMKQYMKDKPIKWGYKLYVLADSSIGYTWNFFVYQ